MSVRFALGASAPIALGALVITALLSFGPAAQAQAQEKQEKKDRAAQVTVDAVRLEQARQSVPVIGRLVARDAGVVSALVKGVVAEMHVHVGDRVEVGDTLAVLAPNALKWARDLRAAEVGSAQANLDNAKAQAKLRGQELKRLENLRSSSAFSPARFEDAQLELAKATSDAARAEADLLRARANLELAEIDLNNANVKAPYAGVVTQSHTAVGTYLNAGQPVVTLVDDNNMEIEADVPADRVQGLAPGTTVSFILQGQSGQSAQVRALVPEENPLTRTRKVRFTPEPGTVAHGAANQSVAIAIPAGPAREALTVHKDAVLNKGGRQVVFVVEGDQANIRPVQLGEAVGGRFQVLSGLNEGDTVVVRGNERLTPGQAVNARPLAQPAQAE